MFASNSSVGLQAWQRAHWLRPALALRGLLCLGKRSPSSESTYVLPNSRYWLQPVLDEITLEQIDARGTGRKFRSRDPRLRRSLLRYLRHDRQLTRSGFDELSRLHPGLLSTRSLSGRLLVRAGQRGRAAGRSPRPRSGSGREPHIFGLRNGDPQYPPGANMAVLRVDHPDIEEFITCKTDENAITNFNISVGITDAFMEAVRRDDLWDLRFPDVSDPAYKGFRGTLEQAEAAGLSIKVYKTVRARDLFDRIVSQAHHNGEPGMLFLDAANRSNPVPHLYQLEATNPCFIGSTRIATDQGLVPIQVLAEQEISFLAAADERAPYAGQGLPDINRKGIAFRPASLAWKTRQNVPVFRLETRHGYSVTATADHKFLTPDRGYVEMGQLKPGDRLLLQSGEGAWSKENSSSEY